MVHAKLDAVVNPKLLAEPEPFSLSSPSRDGSFCKPDTTGGFICEAICFGIREKDAGNEITELCSGPGSVTTLLWDTGQILCSAGPSLVSSYGLKPPTSRKVLIATVTLLRGSRRQWIV